MFDRFFPDWVCFESAGIDDIFFCFFASACDDRVTNEVSFSCRTGPEQKNDLLWIYQAFKRADDVF